MLEFYKPSKWQRFKDYVTPGLAIMFAFACGAFGLLVGVKLFMALGPIFKTIGL